MFRSFLLTTVVALCTASVAQAEEATTVTTSEDVFHPFIISGRGPGAGNTAVGIGGRLLIIIPMLDIQVVHGFTDRVELEARLSTIGVLNFADLGVRARLFGDENFSLALRGDLTAVAFGVATRDEAAGAIGLAGTPGVILSMGSETTQFSVVVDVPVAFFGAAGLADNGDSAGATGTGLAVVIRPQIAVETVVSKDTSLYVMAQAYVTEGGAAPFVGLGLSF